MWLIKTGFGLALTVLTLYAFPQKAEKMVRKHIEKGDTYLFQLNSIERALKEYEKAVQLAPQNAEANFKAGVAQIESLNKSKSIDYFLTTYQLNKNYRSDLTFLIAHAYQYAMEFDKSIAYYNLYKSLQAKKGNLKDPYRIHTEKVNRMIYECENGKEFIMNPKLLEVTNLGKNVNSTYGDYAPVVNADESILILTSRRKEGNSNKRKDENNLPYEEIYISRRIDGQWSKVENIGLSINTKYHDSSLGMSPDGKSLFLYKDLNLGDFYKSDYQPERVWSNPYPVSTINSKYSEKSISVSPEGNYVIFSSNRPGGFGGYDLYISRRNDNGYTRPENLGALINSKYDEDSPFIDYGNTLFFSSKGWKGMGGYDIFESQIDSITGKWLEPKNLGYPVNTTGDDVHFVSSKDGSRAYYASVREGGFGYADIYLMTSLEGSFIEERKELQTSILETDTLDQSILPIIESEQIILPEINSANKDGINNIYFEFDKYYLKAEYSPQLNKLKEQMKNNPNYKLTVIGHTDNVGSAAYNKKLSVQRAEKVAEFLVGKVISKNRLEILGMGATHPLVSNDDEEEGREINRRVEFKFKN